MVILYFDCHFGFILILMNTKPFLQSSFSKLKKLNIKIWGWEKCYFPTLLWIWGWIHFFICCMVYGEGSKYEHLFRSATICIVKNSQSHGFHIKRTDLPFSRLKRVSKMSREGKYWRALSFGIFWYFFKYLPEKKCWPPIELWIWIPGINCLYARLLCCEELPWKPLSVEIEDWREGEVGILEQFGSSRAKVMSAHVFFLYQMK